MVASGESSHRFVVHDHDSIYSDEFDRTLKAMGLTVFKTPVRAPQANAFCERLIGTIRRECHDFVIPLSEGHVRSVLSEWVRYYNHRRPHASLGPGIPEPADAGVCSSGHRIPAGHRVAAEAVLGGLHHDYRLEPAAQLDAGRLVFCGSQPFSLLPVANHLHGVESSGVRRGLQCISTLH
jgi:putative transposase